VTQLEDVSRSSAKKAPAKPKRTAAWWKRPGVLGGIAAGVVALALGVWLLAATVLKVKVKTPEGEAVVVLEIDQPGADVLVDGAKINLTVPGDSKPVEIKVEPGLHKLRIAKEGFEAVTRDIELTVGRSRPIRIRLEPIKVAVKAPEPLPPRSDDFVPLFNGKDLTGWKIQLGGGARWQVQDGVLVGSGGKGSLFNVAGSHENFHLRLEAMINDGGHSGVHFRTLFGPTTPEGRPLSGYRTPINITHKDPHKTGSLYFKNVLVVGLKQSPPIELDGWFTLEIIAEGPLIVLKVNGKNTSSFVDLETGSRLGRIALELLDPATVVKYRKIEIKDLPPRELHVQYGHPKGVFENVKGNVWLETAGTWHGFWRDHARDNLHEGGKVWMNQRRGNKSVYMHITRGNGAWFNEQGSTRWTRVFWGAYSVAPRATAPKRSPAARVGEWTPLLNGKDLSGWQTAGNPGATWTYEGESLVGRCGADPAGLLLTDRNDYDNFHLRMETQLPEVAFCSLFLRCGPSNDGAAGNKCYAIRIGDSRGNAPATGTLVLSAHFDEAVPLLLAVPPRIPLTPAQWFPLEIKAEGRRLQVIVNGKTAVDFVDANETFTIGRLGLVCRGKSVVRFRKLEVKELSASSAK
jgi:hypothetical protein